MEGNIFPVAGNFVVLERRSQRRIPGSCRSYRLFKEVPLLQGEGVSLGDDGDDVDHLTETPHELHIQRPQTGGRRKTLNAQT